VPGRMPCGERRRRDGPIEPELSVPSPESSVTQGAFLRIKIEIRRYNRNMNGGEIVHTTPVVRRSGRKGIMGDNRPGSLISRLAFPDRAL